MSKKVKVGIWGLGRAGGGMHKREIEANSDLLEIVAVCDIDAARAEDFGKKNNVAYYSDPEKFLADKNIDLVAVATFSVDHIRHTRQALEAGFCAYIEKPIAASRAEAEELVELDKKYPGKLFVRQNRRFEPAFQHVREIIDSGILGKIHTIKLCRNNYSRRDDWQTLLANNGGQLNNWGPHLIDQGLRFLESPLASVWGDLKNVACLGDAEDHLKIILKGKNGRIIDIEISGGVSLPSPVYAVYGTRGSLISEDEQDIQLKYLDPKMKMPTGKAHPETPPRNGGFGGSVQPKWIRKTIMTEPANGLTLTDIYHVLYQAIREGKPYPILPEEAFQVVKVTEEVKKQNPAFKIKEDEFGK